MQMQQKPSSNKDDPKFLYRYYRFDEYTEEIFTKNEIYFQKPSKFNDPLDSKICYRKGTVTEKQSFLKRNLPLVNPKLTEQQVNEISKNPSKYEKFINDFCKKQDATRDKLGVYCLTTSKDNILMWAHYSDNHKGFCLEFDRQQDEFFQRAQRVKYSKVLPTYNILEHTVGEPSKHADEFVELLLTKFEGWKYEHEWRLVYTPEYGGPYVHTFPERLLTGVILGFRISDKNRINIIEWCKARTFKPKIYQATPKDGEFGLNIIMLSGGTRI